MPAGLSYIVFTDFDGTITKTDIGDAMFREFGDGPACDAIFDRYRSGELTAQQSWSASCATVRGLTEERLKDFASAIPIDEGFLEFVQFCEAKAVTLVILSDGFGTYIRTVLEREHLSRLPWYSNRLTFEKGAIVPEFPYTDSECDRCANCKRNHLLTLSSEDHVSIYIGDGTSDRCPAGFADVVFAKGPLIAYCERENITYHRFTTFHDILTRFRGLVEANQPRKRRAAEHARRSVFMQG